MRFIHFIEKISVGGLPKYVLKLCDELEVLNHKSLILHSTNENTNSYTNNKIQVVYLEGLDTTNCVNEAKLIDSLGKILRDYKPDILFIHLMTNHVALRFVLDSNIPTLRMFHEYRSLCLRNARQRWPADRCSRPLDWKCFFYGCCLGNPLPGKRFPRLSSLRDKLIEKNMYKEIDLAVVFSQHMKFVLLQNGFCEAKIVVLPYFASLADFPKSDNKLSNLIQSNVKKKHNLVFCGQIIKSKGLQILIKCMPLLKTDCNLTIIGSGNYEEKIQELVKKMNLEDIVEFKGWLNDSEIYNAYDSSDIAIVPSIWDEPFGIVGIDAMASGKAVIAFDVGGISDWLDHGKTGYLVKKIHPEDLASAIDLILADSSNLQKMCYEAKDRAFEYYTKGTHIKNLLNSIYKLLPNESCPA